MAVKFNGGSVSALGADLVQSAGYEIGAFSPGEQVSAADALWALEVLQRIIDQWNAKRAMIFSSGFYTYNLIANLAPHTIGPGGTFDTGPAAETRPVRIASASFVLNPGGSTAVDVPINIRSKDWWAGNPLKGMLSNIITDLYYDPAEPLGNLNFFPVPNVAGVVRLEMWNPLTQAVALNTTLAMAPGYWEALVTTLALALCPSLERDPNPILVSRQAVAIKTIFENNVPVPRIDTSSGMPGTSEAGRPDFDFLTGLKN